MNRVSVIMFSIFIASTAMANNIVIEKTLIGVSKCESLQNNAPQRKLTLAYIVRSSNINYEKVTGLYSYAVRLFNPDAIESASPPKNEYVNETLYFGASAQGSTAQAECTSVRALLLNQIKEK